MAFIGLRVAIMELNAKGHYGCLKAPRPCKQLLTYLLTGSYLLNLDTCGFNQAIMGFTRLLWILLGHYG